MLNHDTNIPLSRSKLITEQRNDPEILPLFDIVLSKDELEKIPIGYFLNNGILMRKWRSPTIPASEEWAVKYQIIIPVIYRLEILKVAHQIPIGGHLGVRKTYDKITQHFYWPKIKRSISQFCKTCHVCQMVGKPNQPIPRAPLKPIPAFEEPFSRVIIDCVGPLPKTKSGNQYLLTIMCASTRFPEAIPLRNITAPKIVKALINFFTLVGLPKEIQSDQGSNFMSGLFQQVIYQLGTKQIKSSAYHPESQGALERFHSTLKNMIRTYCMENNTDWDEGINLLLFAVRESVQESLGFSPFELVFGHTVRGPLKLIKETWLGEESDGLKLLEYVNQFRNRLSKACELASDNLKNAQVKMKVLYDRKTKHRVFKPGDKVLVLLPLMGNTLKAKFHGPYKVIKKVNELDYIVETPDRRKSTQLCHINMLKPYYVESKDKHVLISQEYPEIELDNDLLLKNLEAKREYKVKLNNSEILGNLEAKLHHLPTIEKENLKNLLWKYRKVFPDVPSTTNVLFHDVEVGKSDPIKQHPYRVNPIKLSKIRTEIDYMLKNNIIEPSQSNWASPCILVPKPDGSMRFCTDYRKVNAVTKTDSYPIPRMEDCIDRIGHATFITKCDLLKGYWGVPLTPRAKEISAFVTPDALWDEKQPSYISKNDEFLFLGCGKY